MALVGVLVPFSLSLGFEVDSTWVCVEITVLMRPLHIIDCSSRRGKDFLMRRNRPHISAQFEDW